jgi:hypothetical protein
VSNTFWGFFLGALVVVLLTERRRITSPSFRLDRGRAAHLTREEWDEVLPLARAATRARWENSGEISEDDDWLAGLVIFLAALLIAAAWVFTDSWLPPFLTYLAMGATIALALYGVYAWARRFVLPPDARLVIVRAVVIVVFAHVIIRWTGTTTYADISLDAIREVVLPVDVTRRPGELTDTFHASGWALAVSIVIARGLVVALVLRTLLELLAMVAAVRLAEGSQRAFAAWLAQFYPRRPVRRTVAVAIIGALAVILGSGQALQWWDDVQGDEPVLPVPGGPAPTAVPTAVPTTAVPVTEVPPTTVP